MKIKRVKPISDIDFVDKERLIVEFDKDSDFVLGLYILLGSYGVKSYQAAVAETYEDTEFMPLSKAINYRPNGEHIVGLLHETGNVMKRQTESIDFVVYLVDQNKNNIFICPEDESYFYRTRFHFNIELRRTVAIHVYRTNVPLNISTSQPDMRFPDFQEIPEIYATNIMSVPMKDFQNSIVGIFEMFRDNSISYNDLEFQRFQFLATWMAEGIQQNQQEVTYERFNKITDILSTNLQDNFTRKYRKHNDDFLNVLVKTAKLTFDAESAAVFLKNIENELYKEVTTENLSALKLSKFKLRIGKELQLAQIPADSNVIINYKDVYSDARFDNKVDIKTGKIIRSVLATPIRVDHKHKYGVIQLINKLNDDYFTNVDEDFLKTFDEYSALWLHYKWACKEIHNMRILSGMLREMIITQWKTIDDTRETFSIDETIYMPNNFLSFDFHPFPDHMMDLQKFIYYMILVSCKDTFSNNRAPLYCFVNIVKKFYMTGNEFYSMERAFLVVHFIFVFFKRYEYENSYEPLSELEKFAYLVSSLCCFIDCETKLVNHINTNRYHLVELYEKYAIEKHQFWVTKLIIMSSGILKNLSKKEENIILKMIEDCLKTLSFQSTVHLILNRRILNQNNITEKPSKQFLKTFLLRASLSALATNNRLGAVELFRTTVKLQHRLRNMFMSKEITLNESCELAYSTWALYGACLELLCKNYKFLNQVLIAQKACMDAVSKMTEADIF